MGAGGLGCCCISGGEEERLGIAIPFGEYPTEPGEAEEDEDEEVLGPKYEETEELWTGEWYEEAGRADVDLDDVVEGPGEGAVTGILLYKPIGLCTSPADGAKNSSDGRCTVGGTTRMFDRDGA